jgi:hypothetical protein
MITNIIIVTLVTSLIAFIIYKKDKIAVGIKQVSPNFTFLKSIPTRILGKPSYPERDYVPKYNQERASQQVGYVTDNIIHQLYPLYENRLNNNYYYHIIDASRNSVKIPFTNQRKEQVYDNDTIKIPEISEADLTIKIYDYPSTRF